MRIAGVRFTKIVLAICTAQVGVRTGRRRSRRSNAAYEQTRDCGAKASFKLRTPPGVDPARFFERDLRLCVRHARSWRRWGWDLERL